MTSINETTEQLESLKYEVQCFDFTFLDEEISGWKPSYNPDGSRRYTKNKKPAWDPILVTRSFTSHITPSMFGVMGVDCHSLKPIRPSDDYCMREITKWIDVFSINNRFVSLLIRFTPDSGRSSLLIDSDGVVRQLDCDEYSSLRSSFYYV